MNAARSRLDGSEIRRRDQAARSSASTGRSAASVGRQEVRMDKPRAPASFSAQLVAAILLACLVATLSVLFLSYTAVNAVDADAEARQIRFAQRAIVRETRRLLEQQQASTVWDEAVLHVRNGNRDWIDANLGTWMHEQYGQDETYIVDPDSRIVYVAREGVTGQPGPRSTLPPAVETMVEQMRAATRNPAESTADVAELSLTRFVLLGGKPALVSVVPIVPDTPALVQPAGTEYLHVAIQKADVDMAARLSSAYEFDRGSFSVQPGPDDRLSVPLRDAAGQPIAWFVWRADRPGHRIVEEMLPVVGLFAAFGAALLSWLLRTLWTASRRLHQSEEEARYLAMHDPLAGIPNRTLFEDRLDQALKAEKRGGPAVALLCLDLDRFKAVNDTMGHQAGDELIRQMAARLRSHVRETDTVARLGGDEFGVILIGMTSDETLGRYCSGLVHLLAAPCDLKCGQVQIGASIGAVRAATVEGGKESLLRSADTALYRAKAEGRGRYCIATPEMTDMFRRRHEIERDLRRAVAEGGQIHVLYQPIFDAEERIVAAEALVRWNHPALGQMGPETFLSIAEETGLIERIGHHVLEQACILAATSGIPRVSVNVSPVQLRHEAFADEVLAVMAAHALSGERLVLELTERFTLDAGPSTLANLARLRAAGVSIALDDFATGQSLLRYVRDYQIDTIKIDRSYVARLGTGDGTDQIVRAILDLGRAMGIEVTAEGVERASQREALLGMGCHGFQGYLLGRPMDPLRLAALSARKGVAQKSA
ncbi:putative bifunctional diguanylate cyclase/phosphodiesterase [Cereibacter johrii]|uniref:putative bifunctional diguanylate cyclase/phosphodiesterase n=1 Tax=Cereibacter johrii TaxID=445629 RepID=UPI000DCEFF5D|nr:bifunctional diguanylate cyclase/phosphodiesterase [Cereibacter johrii]RAZ85169.1 bifunctional diguanylate cyclase/phosphodiesterase [Cereibacter johrii]